MKTAITEFLARYIDKAIYVWGGQGENVCEQKTNGILNPEGWIRSKESKAENADRAIALYRQRVANGVNPVIAVDCSGLVVEMLRAFGILKPNADRNTKGLYAMCNSHPTRDKLKMGDLVFRSKDPLKPEEIYHVGIYVGDGKVVEAKGRAYGVIETDINSYNWNMYGRMTKLQPFTEEIPEPSYPDEPLSLSRDADGDAYRKLQDALNWLGYTDRDHVPLVLDGQWGTKSRQAWNKAVGINLPVITGEVSLHLADVTDKKYRIGEEIK